MLRFSTAAGSPKRESDDRVAVFEAGDGLVVCVADGVGGAAGGAAAAERFVASVRRRVEEAASAREVAWTALLGTIDGEIAADPSAGETTGIALAVSGGEVVGASVGDSRAWLVAGGAHFDLTRAQPRKPRLGTGEARAMPFAAAAHGTLVVGTDGLFDYVRPAEIVRVAAAHQDRAAEALVGLLTERYAKLPDDVAIVTVQLSL